MTPAKAPGAARLSLSEYLAYFLRNNPTINFRYVPRSVLSGSEETATQPPHPSLLASRAEGVPRRRWSVARGACTRGGG